MELQGRVALITGGKRIGAVVAQTLARGGADVVLVYHRSADEAEAAAAAVRALGRRAETVRADLADPDECQRVVTATVAAMGRIDILVAMASLYQPRLLAELTAEHWDEQLDLELRSAFVCAHAAIPEMRRQGGGRIIVVSDWVAASGRPRYPGYLPYYVAKAALNALAEGLALELAAEGILVNAVAPGPIIPPPGTTDAEIRKVAEATPVGRWGGEAEIAKAIAFLVDSEFVTGETIRVDGGRHLK